MKKIWSFVAIPATMLAVLTGSLGWVLLVRPFYYAQIGPLGLRIDCKRRSEALPRLGGRTPGFWAACALGGVILVVAALAATDFDRAFTVFHSIFFPGKDNWLFDPATDPVIALLPEEFFRNCAIAIAASLLGLCLVLVLTGRKQKK